jgi:exonuclease VII large subunit
MESAAKQRQQEWAGRQRGLERAAEAMIKRRRVQLQTLRQRLASVNPAGVLNRGYSIVTRGARGRIVTGPGQAKSGEVVRIQGAGGTWRAAALDANPDLFEDLSDA